MEMRVAEAGRLSDDRGMLLTCQTGYQDFLAREIEEAGGSVLERGPGWVRGAFVRGERPDLAFAHLGLIAPVEIAGDSVNVLAQRVGEYFLTGLRGERVGAEWPSVWLGPHEIVGLGRRVGAVETAFGVLLKKRLSRVARLAVPGDSILRANRQPHPHLPDTPVAEANRPAGGGSARGLFVYFADFGRAFVTREAWTGGHSASAMDSNASSPTMTMPSATGLTQRSRPLCNFQSMGFTALAATSTKTCQGPGCGVGTSAMTSCPAPP